MIENLNVSLPGHRGRRTHRVRDPNRRLDGSLRTKVVDGFEDALSRTP
jgi:hypothetical protein